MLNVGLEKAKASVAPSTVIDSPIAPSRVMAAIRVVFLPWNKRGTLPRRPSFPSEPWLSGASAGGVEAGLVHEYEAPSVEAGSQPPPQPSGLLIPLLSYL